MRFLRKHFFILVLIFNLKCLKQIILHQINEKKIIIQAILFLMYLLYIKAEISSIFLVKFHNIKKKKNSFVAGFYLNNVINQQSNIQSQNTQYKN